MEGYGNDNPGAFQSSPSARRATGGIPDNAVYQGISIPAFREEGDLNLSRISQDALKISIPAFREEGDVAMFWEMNKTRISIPAFREEGDLRATAQQKQQGNFNPRLP